MIGLNGSLVAVLCVAYFVLIACALSFARATAADDRSMQLPDNELERRRSLHSRATTRGYSELPVVVAYARTTMDHERESRRVDAMIDATVLTMRHDEQHDTGDDRMDRAQLVAR